MIKLLIVDDHQLIREGIKSLLENVRGIQIVGDASTGEEALQRIKELKVKPDIILMDLRMPGIGGIETTRKLQRVFPTIKVLGVTSCNDQLFATNLLRAGAKGYLTKGANQTEVIRAIRTVASGQIYISYEVANQLAISHISNSQESPFHQLSGRELQIAMMVIDGKNSHQIAKDLNLTSKTINSYRYRIFEKLQIKSDVELIRLGMQFGLLKDTLG